jgi:hypothetical protein
MRQIILNQYSSMEPIVSGMIRIMDKKLKIDVRFLLPVKVNGKIRQISNMT